MISDKNLWQLLQLRIAEKRISEAVVFLRENNIEPILIKGWAAAQLYPEPHERGFTDIDLMVSAENYEAAVQSLREYKDTLLIDLHREAKHLDRVPYRKLYENSILINCGGTGIRVLCPEDHLRILCVHWLIDGGAKKDKLRDIYYAVKNRPADFDWDRCLNAAGQTRRKWIICTIGLAHKYLGLEVGDTPIAESVEEIPGWLIKAVEKEWRSETPLIPLHFLSNDRTAWWRQIKKRIPPNPIQATVEMEGEFDDKPRFYYQIGDILYRLPPSIKRIVEKFRK